MSIGPEQMCIAARKAAKRDNNMKQHHVILSGTGRTNTTLLFQLSSKLGPDTGFTSNDDHVYQTCNAGIGGEK